MSTQLVASFKCEIYIQRFRLNIYHLSSSLDEFYWEFNILLVDLLPLNSVMVDSQYLLFRLMLLSTPA